MGNFYEAANFDWREIKREGEKNDVALDRRGGLFCPRVRPHPHNKARKKMQRKWKKRLKLKKKKHSSNTFDRRRDLWGRCAADAIKSARFPSDPLRPFHRLNCHWNELYLSIVFDLIQLASIAVLGLVWFQTLGWYFDHPTKWSDGTAFFLLVQVFIWFCAT